MARFFVTRGLGGSVSSLISSGFIDDVRAAIRGSRRFAKKALESLEENIKISVMLLGINGKELAKPIISSVARTFKADQDFSLSVTPKKLVVRRSDDISVRAKLSIGEENESN